MGGSIINETLKTNSRYSSDSRSGFSSINHQQSLNQQKVDQVDKEMKQIEEEMYQHQQTAKKQEEIKEEVIKKYQEGNNLLQNIIQQLEEQIKSKLEKQRKVNTVMTHRDVGQVHPSVQERNSHLQKLQIKINGQKQHITSLKQKIESVVQSGVKTEMDNKLSDLLREIKQLKSQKKTLSDVNVIQLNAYSQLTGDTDYAGQIKKINQQIQQFKDQCKVLQDQRQQEDNNFRSQFERLSMAEEQRFKLREQIIQVKNTFRQSIDINSGGLQSQRGTSSDIQLPKLLRVNSQTRRINKAADQELRGAAALQNGILSIQKKYRFQKKKIEQDLENIAREMECMEIEIAKKNDENIDLQEQIKDQTKKQQQFQQQQDNQQIQ
ncbi:UNKNOWN [Stylonychia lemnae]|uniref:Uncharacterized protein n=1 Tax=Stylonychia lemnae TaxID=5949 RepID=A0A078AGA9_STYLE|nr:UNKNOWN [Stylonychia lemnae]|eukprot:CDW81269.1 UNKNOWN [Stylonychia lemnae]